MAGAQGEGGGQPAEYIGPGESDELVKTEQQQLRSEFGKRDDVVWTGLALSGGGVRSATFCLGALQAFDKAGILERFDYQSSVSGGGFTGLSWLWYRRQQGGTFPFRDESAPLNFLRRNIGYLNPSSKIDYFSGAVAVLRTIFLNLLVWIPIVTLLFLILLGTGSLFGQLESSFGDLSLRLVVKMAAIAALAAIPAGVAAWRTANAPDGEIKQTRRTLLWVRRFVVRFVIYAILIALLGGLWLRLTSSLSAAVYGEAQNQGQKFLGFSSLTVLGLFVVGLAAAASVAASLSLGRVSDWLNQTRTRLPMLILMWLVLALLVFTFYTRELICFSLSFPYLIIRPNTWVDKLAVSIPFLPVPIILLALLARLIGENREYIIFRKLDETASEWAPVAIALLLIGSMPLVSPKSTDSMPANLVAIAALVYGTLTAIYSHYASFRNLAPGAAGRLAMMSGAAVFLCGLLLLCYSVANTVYTSGYQVAPIFILLTSLWALFFTNINQIGLHRYYRDRIAETFFADSDSMEKGVSGATADGISEKLEDLPKKQKKEKPLLRPYPIVNMNAILVDDPDTKTRLRGGANFIASPLYSGSDATGWLTTSIFGGQNVGRPLHAATVTAASGAAVNSGAGYAGTGITRNRIVSIAMRLLNVRLGYWLVNPYWLNKRGLEALKWRTKTTPTHFRPGLVHLMSNNWKRTAKFVELSDGGHFDNLGIYELLRRRCDLILVCDGEADKDTSYAGLVSVARRAKEDFGVEIAFRPGLGPERMVANLPLGYPSNAKAAASPYMAAEVHYPENSLGPAKYGIIIYIKATMIDDVSFVTKGYKGRNPDFPHQSTVDQFFQAEQFEAYRELGFVAAGKCARELNIAGLFGKPMDIWTRYVDGNKPVRQ